MKFLKIGYWLIKFDGLDGNGDKEDDDKWGYGRVEYAYSLMAKAAGIEMSECRLWDQRHFMTRRFDRTSSGGKPHMQTLGAIWWTQFAATAEVIIVRLPLLCTFIYVMALKVVVVVN